LLNHCYHLHRLQLLFVPQPFFYFVQTFSFWCGLEQIEFAAQIKNHINIAVQITVAIAGEHASKSMVDPAAITAVL
jgi:hypothetical protein